MKHLLIIAFSYLITSCCSTKEVIDTTTKPIAKVEHTNNDEPSKIILKNQDTSIVELEKEKDSLTQPKPFHQNLTKRFITIHQIWDELLNIYVSESGNVNYKGLKKDHKKLLDYIYVLDLTKRRLPKFKDEKEELAFWINAYNAMTVDLILRNYPVNSIKDIKDPWNQRLWKLGEKWYNLDEIEHQIIRKMGEPRIHFALVCAAVSCPKLYNKAFTANHLEEDLAKLTREFLEDKLKNDLSGEPIKLSKIFKWFAKDFKQDGSLIDFLNKYSDETVSSNSKKVFNAYNWDLNE